jgi:hypothetical protein
VTVAILKRNSEINIFDDENNTILVALVLIGFLKKKVDVCRDGPKFLSKVRSEGIDVSFENHNTFLPGP